jgi:hypothetical protein
MSQVKRNDEGILSLSLGHNIRVLKWVHVDVEVHLTWNKGRELSGGRPAELQLLTPMTPGPQTLDIWQHPSLSTPCRTRVVERARSCIDKITMLPVDPAIQTAEYYRPR